ncbi:MAG: hypothetical protein K2X35_07460 [Bryobacteraceae bacterium]|nr:hypothetical protein [Bryobacteraceae bacterium]
MHLLLPAWFSVAAVCLAQAPAVDVVFLEPVTAVDASGAELKARMPTYRKVADVSRYRGWMNNEMADRALRLYRAAVPLINPGATTAHYYIALVRGGNHAGVGFRIAGDGGTEDLPHQPYLVLGPEEFRFQVTLLHETMHVVMAMLAGNRLLEGDRLASIPHTTAALTDRTTAFSEGYAIHAEALAAHLGREASLRKRYHREHVVFGGGQPYQADEYFRQASDLPSYSQNLARYLEVRENSYAFESAWQGPDYLRVQLEKARDLATLRDANQLLQSEGSYASFFFLWVIRGSGVPGEEIVMDREVRLLRAMSAMFAKVKAEPGTPWLPHLVQAYTELFPDERNAMAEAFADLTRGVFTDGNAAGMWRQHYLAALRLDLEKLNRGEILGMRKKWVASILADPSVLFTRLGPQISCTVPARVVQLTAFSKTGEALRFDLNTAPGAILRMIPGITEEEVARWLSERAAKAFANGDDFRGRVRLNEKSWAELRFP